MGKANYGRGVPKKHGLGRPAGRTEHYRNAGDDAMKKLAFRLGMLGLTSIDYVSQESSRHRLRIAPMMVYKEKYPVGTKVRIAPADRLQVFQRDWKYHHKLQDEQLAFAGTADAVRTVGFYHGGDVIYNLENAPELGTRLFSTRPNPL
jgi:hypothetical protein